MWQWVVAGVICAVLVALIVRTLIKDWLKKAEDKLKRSTWL